MPDSKEGTALEGAEEEDGWSEGRGEGRFGRGEEGWVEVEACGRFSCVGGGRGRERTTPVDALAVFAAPEPVKVLVAP